jgi:hypothetical protein
MNIKEKIVGKEMAIKEIKKTGTLDLMLIQRGPGPVLIRKAEGIQSRVVDLIDFLLLLM